MPKIINSEPPGITVTESIFVPFEWDGNNWNVVSDIPRFTQASECIKYINRHPELARRHIDWQERQEKEFIDEYIRGVGASP
ncbi:MAG: hypothetical protein ACP5P4_16995 [Steroidobacteraceae bacterium]